MYEIRNVKFSYVLESSLEVFKGRSETRLLEVINLPQRIELDEMILEVPSHLKFL